MEKQELWQHGFSRMPNSLARLMTSVNKASTLGLMLWCVVNAQRTEGIVDGFPIKRGQLCVNLKELSKQLHMTYYAIRKALDELNDELLTKCSTINRGKRSRTIITICNFDNYRGPAYPHSESQNAATANRYQTADDTPLNEERTEDKEEEKTLSSSLPDFGVSKSTPSLATAPSPTATSFIPVAELRTWIMSHTIWANTYKLNHHLTDAQLDAWVGKFVVYLQSIGTTAKDAKDVLMHFSNWHAKRRDFADAEERRRKQLIDRDLRKQEEIRRIEEESRIRAKQEAEELARRNFEAIKQAAANGDEYAQAVLKKHGF